MSNSKVEKEELKKLEDEAYNELCQIIAEAMQVQDITLLDQRIANWKKKYKKLLDSSSPSSSNFKKRIEYLLNQFYSEITQYILKQIKKSEQKRVENQSKALRKLRYIIDETDDLSLLKKKVKEWQNKYPITGFLNMYQKRIKVYTSEKHLKEHAFDQDMAFRDLYYITKLKRTYDEFKEEISKWEDKYSIHDKFELEDFIKNQSEVNRYTSDEYLKSIAHADNSDNQGLVLFEEKFHDSSLSKQSAAYSSLASIARKPNNINEIFNWVYKYNSIKFNDEYKSLILTAINFDYSPTYLNSLSVPKINLSGSLSFEEYQKIDEIKRYAVISYFNLLLPPEARVSNNYFNEHIEKIYRNSRTAHFSNEYNEFDRVLEENAEIKASPTKTEMPELQIDISTGQVFDIHSNMESVFETTAKDKTPDEELLEEVKQPSEDLHENESDIKIVMQDSLEEKIDTLEDTTAMEKSLQEDLDVLEIKPPKQVLLEKDLDVPESDITHNNCSEDNLNVIEPKEPLKESLDALEIKTAESNSIKTQSSTQDSFDKKLDSIEEKAIVIDQPDVHTKEHSFKEEDETLTSLANEQSQDENIPLNGDTIVAVSPLFFEAINAKVNTHKKQSKIISEINDSVDTYMISTVNKTIDNVKTRNSSD